MVLIVYYFFWLNAANLEEPVTTKRQKKESLM